MSLLYTRYFLLVRPRLISRLRFATLFQFYQSFLLSEPETFTVLLIQIFQRCLTWIVQAVSLPEPEKCLQCVQNPQIFLDSRQINRSEMSYHYCQPFFLSQPQLLLFCRISSGCQTHSAKPLAYHLCSFHDLQNNTWYQRTILAAP